MEATPDNDDVVEIKDPKAVLNALTEAKANAVRLREERNALREQLAQAETDEGIAKWKTKAVHAEVRAALREQGVKDVARVLKIMDLEGVDLDDNDKLVGFDEKAKAAKTEWPELFDAKRRVANGADIFADGEVKKEMSGTEAQVARLFQ